MVGRDPTRTSQERLKGQGSIPRGSSPIAPGLLAGHMSTEGVSARAAFSHPGFSHHSGRNALSIRVQTSPFLSVLLTPFLQKFFIEPPDTQRCLHFRITEGYVQNPHFFRPPYSQARPVNSEYLGVGHRLLHFHSAQGALAHSRLLRIQLKAKSINTKSSWFLNQIQHQDAGVGE